MGLSSMFPGVSLLLVGTMTAPGLGMAHRGSHGKLLRLPWYPLHLSVREDASAEQVEGGESVGPVGWAGDQTARTKQFPPRSRHRDLCRGSGPHSGAGLCGRGPGQPCGKQPGSRRGSHRVALRRRRGCGLDCKSGVAGTITSLAARRRSLGHDDCCRDGATPAVRPDRPTPLRRRRPHSAGHLSAWPSGRSRPTQPANQAKLIQRAAGLTGFPD